MAPIGWKGVKKFQVAPTFTARFVAVFYELISVYRRISVSSLLCDVRCTTLCTNICSLYKVPPWLGGNCRVS